MHSVCLLAQHAEHVGIHTLVGILGPSEVQVRVAVDGLVEKNVRQLGEKPAYVDFVRQFVIRTPEDGRCYQHLRNVVQWWRGLR